MAPERLDSQAGLSSSSEKPSNSFHSSSLLSTQYGLSLDPKVAAVDALYSISEVFLFIAGTEHQFLNMMAILLKKQLNPTLDYMEATIKNLNHIKASIDSHHEYLEEALRCLEHGGDDNWPKASLSAHKDIAERTRNALVGDFSHLLQRAVKLSKSCTTGCNAITNSTMLQEARAGLQQGAQMKRLTILAFLYLPLNLTTSFFGMNFREFGQGTLSLAWILAVLVPVVLITVGLFSWTAISKLFRGRKGKKDKGVEDAASQTPTLPKTATV
jgi:Mg2+ and Co2+ transporter CorA